MEKFIIPTKLVKPRPPWLLVGTSPIINIMATLAFKFFGGKFIKIKKMFTCEGEILIQFTLEKD